MNTKIEFITWTDQPRSKVYSIFEKGLEQFDKVVQQFSRFDKKSELSILNASSGTEVKVSHDLFRLVEFALGIAKKTNGSFDPTIIDLLEMYGYKTKCDFSKLDNREQLQKEIHMILKRRPAYQNIKLNKTKKTIQLEKNQRIDLGGIGKGYAIDLAYDELLPLKNFLINAGGDIRAVGVDETNKPWLIELKTPGLPSFGAINLDNQAICCSGSQIKKIKSFHHLINPVSGKPQDTIKTIFVIAENALLADTWATALFVTGKTNNKLAKKNNIQTLTVNKDNTIFRYNFPKFIKMN